VKIRPGQALKRRIGEGTGYRLAAGPAGLSVSAEGELAWIANVNDVGRHSVRIVQDKAGDIKTIRIQIEAVASDGVGGEGRRELPADVAPRTRPPGMHALLPSDWRLTPSRDGKALLLLQGDSL
jgi:hypothetical protein